MTGLSLLAGSLGDARRIFLTDVGQGRLPTERDTDDGAPPAQLGDVIHRWPARFVVVIAVGNFRNQCRPSSAARPSVQEPRGLHVKV